LNGGSRDLLHSEKSREIIEKQVPIDKAIVERVKKALARKGVVLEQSSEWDRHLIMTGREAITYSDGTIVMHNRVSASGFFEELIHYGQVRSGRAVYGDEENMLLMEIEAQKRLLAFRGAYKITPFEVEILTNNLNWYTIQLENLRKGGM